MTLVLANKRVKGQQSASWVCLYLTCPGSVSTSRELTGGDRKEGRKERSKQENREGVEEGFITLLGDYRTTILHLVTDAANVNWL